MIRVLILAVSENEAASLAEFLAEDDRIEVVQSATLNDTFADVILVSGVAIPQRTFAEIPVVVLGRNARQSLDFRGSIRAHLPSNATAAEVLAAINAVAQGFLIMTSSQAEALMPGQTEDRAPALSPLAEALTPREIQVLLMMAEGSANKEIADQLRISEHTVKFHVASILGKLQASSRTEAVTQGIRRGLVPI